MTIKSPLEFGINKIKSKREGNALNTSADYMLPAMDNVIASLFLVFCRSNKNCD
jgi:hypothetical protein